MAIMNFSDEQLKGLNAAYTRQQQGSANQTDIANLDYAKAGGFNPTPPADNINTVPPKPESPTVPSETISPKPLESSPGVFKASSLGDFYKNQLDLMKPQYEAANANLNNINSQITSMMSAPGLTQQYQTQYTEQIKPVEEKMTGISSQVNKLDESLRAIEDDVRAQLGGRAPESILKAEVARRATPLTKEREALVNQYNTLSNQRTQTMQGLTTQLGFQESDINRQTELLQYQQKTAQGTVDAFNNLIEKGATATAQDQTNAQNMFMSFIEADPTFVSKLSEDELAQLQGGSLPYSVLEKINTSAAVTPISVGAGSSLVNPVTGEVIYQGAEQGLTQSQRMTAAINLMAVDPYIQNINEALARVDSTMGYAGSYGGSTADAMAAGGNIPGFQPVNVDTGKKMGEMTPEELLTLQQAMQSREGYYPGSAAYDNNNPGNIKWSDFAASVGGVDSGRKATDGGSFAKFPTYEAGVMAQLQLLQSPNYANLSLDQAMRRWSGGGYGADVLSSLPTTSKNSVPTSTANNLGLGGPGLSIDQQGDALLTTKPVITKTESETLLAPPNKIRRKDTDYFDDATKQSAAFKSEKVVQDFEATSQNYNKILSAQPTPAGDISLVFAYMKMLDPGSVVREGEYATAKNATGIPERVRNAYNKAMSGKLLDENQRTDFKDQAFTLIKSQKPAYLDKVKFYADRARGAGIDPNDVVAFTVISSPSPTTSKTENVDLSTFNFKF